MHIPQSADLRQAIRRELLREAGADAGAKELAAATLRISGAMANRLALLIGAGGVRALAGRSLHLAQRDFPWLDDAQPSDSLEGPFAPLLSGMERQPPRLATEAAAAVLATLCGLLATLIGETLTMGVLRTAWPSAFPNETQQEWP